MPHVHAPHKRLLGAWIDAGLKRRVYDMARRRRVPVSVLITEWLEAAIERDRQAQKRRKHGT